MASLYPGNLDSFTNPQPTDRQGDEVGGLTHSEMHGAAFDAIEAIETELGTNPSGDAATVKARLDGIDATIQQVKVPAGGTSGQILAKQSATDYDAAWVDDITVEMDQLVRAAAGVSISLGQAVYVTGATGVNVRIGLAQANSEATSSKTLGLAKQSLAPNAEGYVVTDGLLAGIDTSTATVGDPIWLSPTVAGGLVFGLTNKPSAPNHLVYLGVVVRAHQNGTVFVHVQNGFELDELHNVALASLVDKDILAYESSTGLWKNKTATALGLVGTSDSRLTDARTPTSHATSHGSAGSDPITVAQSQVTGLATSLAGKVDTSDSRLTDTRTPTDGTVTDAKIVAGGLSPSVVTGTAVITSDARLSNSRTPTAHAASHAAAGSDPLTLSISQVNTLQSVLNGKAALASANAFTVGGHTIATGADATIGLAIARNSSSQTGNMLEIRDNVANVVSAFSPFGSLAVRTGGTVYSNAALSVSAPSAATVASIIRGATSQSADMNQWQTWDGTTATTVAKVAADGSLSVTPAGNVVALNVTQNAGARVLSYGGNGLINNSTSTLGFGTWGAVATTEMYSGLATRVVTLIKGAASQSADALQVQNSAGTVLTTVSAFGALSVRNGGVVSLNTIAVSAFINTGNVNNLGLVVQGQASQYNDLLRYADSSATTIGGRNANAQIFSGSAAPLAVGVGGATTAASGDGTTATITTTSAHNLAVGDFVVVAGITPTGYNGTYRVTAVTSTTLSYLNATTGAQTVAGTVSATAQTSVTARSAATVGQIIRMAASQSVDAWQVQTSSGTVQASVNTNGRFTSGDTTGFQVGPSNFGGLYRSGSTGVLELFSFNETVANPGASRGRIYFKNGTNAGTLKLVVRAGAAGAETTILDNIPQ